MTAPSPIALNSTTPQSSTSPTSGSVDLREINAAPNQIAQRTQTLSPAQARALTESRQKSLDQLTEILSDPNLSGGERATQILQNGPESSEQRYLQKVMGGDYVPRTPKPEPKFFLELDTPKMRQEALDRLQELLTEPNQDPATKIEQLLKYNELLNR
jgi:hypothetical protein